MKNQISDAALVNAFAQRVGTKRYQATFIPETEQSVNWSELDARYLTADSKKEAIAIAREYAVRFLGKRMAYLYYTPTEK